MTLVTHTQFPPVSRGQGAVVRSALTSIEIHLAMVHQGSETIEQAQAAVASLVADVKQTLGVEG